MKRIIGNSNNNRKITILNKKNTKEMVNLKNEKRLQSEAKAFREYLRFVALTPQAYRFMEFIASQTDIYIFSCLILDCLAANQFGMNDIDIIVKDIDVIKFPSRYKVVKNQYGGYTLKVHNINIWGIKQTQSLAHLNIDNLNPQELSKSAFFNFASILYDWNNDSFVFDDSFLSFYPYGVMDVVNENIPNPDLAIVSTLYYGLAYDFRIRCKLCRWIVNHFNSEIDYTAIAPDCLHEAYFEKDMIDRFINLCRQSLPKLEEDPYELSMRVII